MCVSARARVCVCVSVSVSVSLYVCDCVCVSVCVCVYVSLASDCWETVQVIITKLGRVTASDMIMHPVLIILTSTFIQGHTDQNNKSSIISETVQAMPIMFAVEIIVRLKLYIIFSQSDDLDSRSQLRLKLDKC